MPRLRGLTKFHSFAFILRLSTIIGSAAEFRIQEFVGCCQTYSFDGAKSTNTGGLAAYGDGSVFLERSNDSSVIEIPVANSLGYIIVHSDSYRSECFFERGLLPGREGGLLSVYKLWPPFQSVMAIWWLFLLYCWSYIFMMKSDLQILIGYST